eukprot:c21415_g1_i1.p1 GENE.c21415_g1_i1~~c21415_g1_i1.p1  ORF type:complete len:183 (-),score=93.44 c21415_g1_i1:2-550(-)
MDDQDSEKTKTETTNELVSQKSGEMAEKAGGAAVIAGAAAAGLAAGVAVSGVAVGVAVAGLAVAATQRSDEIGDAARATGNAVVHGYEKAKEYSEEHHIGDKVKEVTQKAVHKAKEIDEQYHVVEKAKIGANTAIAKAKEIDAEYHISTKVATGVSSGVNAVTKAISPRGTSTVTPEEPSST